MSYTRTVWVDRIAERPMTFTETINEDGSKTFASAEKVIKRGTPVNAANMNHIEQGIYDVEKALQKHDMDNEDRFYEIEENIGLAVSASEQAYAKAEASEAMVAALVAAPIKFYTDTATSKSVAHDFATRFRLFQDVEDKGFAIVTVNFTFYNNSNGYRQVLLQNDYVTVQRETKVAVSGEETVFSLTYIGQIEDAKNLSLYVKQNSSGALSASYTCSIAFILPGATT